MGTDTCKLSFWQRVFVCSDAFKEPWQRTAASIAKFVLIIVTLGTLAIYWLYQEKHVALEDRVHDCFVVGNCDASRRFFYKTVDASQQIDLFLEFGLKLSDGYQGTFLWYDGLDTKLLKWCHDTLINPSVAKGKKIKLFDWFRNHPGSIHLLDLTVIEHLNCMELCKDNKPLLTYLALEAPRKCFENEEFKQWILANFDSIEEPLIILEHMAHFGQLEFMKTLIPRLKGKEVSDADKRALSRIVEELKYIRDKTISNVAVSFSILVSLEAKGLVENTQLEEFYKNVKERFSYDALSKFKGEISEEGQAVVGQIERKEEKLRLEVLYVQRVTEMEQKMNQLYSYFIQIDEAIKKMMKGILKSMSVSEMISALTAINLSVVKMKEVLDAEDLNKFLDKQQIVDMWKIFLGWKKWTTEKFILIYERSPGMMSDKEYVMLLLDVCTSYFQASILELDISGTFYGEGCRYLDKAKSLLVGRDFEELQEICDKGDEIRETVLKNHPEYGSAAGVVEELDD